MRIFFSAVLSLVATAALAAPLSPEWVSKEIEKHSAREVVTRLWSRGDYDRVMDRIDAGDGSWIALAPALARGADAGPAEELPIALAFALPKNPRAVLSVLGPPNGLPVDDVCSAPFIEDTVKDIPAYVRRAEKAVAGVSQPGLESVKNACLAALRKV